jgi:tetratricopeptide (TPR) repeat protein
MSLRNIARSSTLLSLALLSVVFWAGNANAQHAAAETSPWAVHGTSQAPQEKELSAQEVELREAINHSPNNPANLARLGSVLAMQNKLEESTQYFEKALKLNPGDIETRRSLAAGYWQLGQLEKARENLETVLKSNPADTLAMLFLGMVSEDLGDHQRAAALLGGVLPLVRQRPETIASLARAYYRLDETQKARDTVRMLVGHPSGPEAAFQGGRLAAELGDFETAEKLFLSIQATYPDPTVVNYNLALAQFSAKHYDEAEKTLRASIGYGHGTPETYALLGWTCEKQDRLPEMLEAFEKAINMDPANETYFLDLGEALVEKKNYATAIEVVKEAAKRFPSSSRAYSLKGSTELKMYLLTEALKSYAKAVELDPNNPRAALGLALTQWNMDRTDEAAKSFEEGARKFPHDGFFLLKYALFLLNAPGERDAAADAQIKSLLKRSEELDGSDAETHFQLGNLAMKENKYDEALNELQTAAKLDPEIAKVHLVLARLYRRAGREEDAQKETELHRKLKAQEEQNSDVNAAIGTRHP